MQVLLDHIVDESPTVKTFYFKPGRPLRYEAGQYIDLSLGKSGRRWFSLSSAPEEKLLSITSTFKPPLSSYKQALLGMKPGDSLTMSEPMGDFVLPKDSTRRIIFAAGGIGITPVRSIIQHLKLVGETRDIKLIYSASSPDDFMFTEIFTDLHTEYRLTADNNRINAQTVVGNTALKESDLIYISGPEQMVEQLRNDLINIKIAAEQIVGDYFNGY